MESRFTRTTFFIWGGLLIWAADFLFVYVFAALACARGFEHMRIAGVGVVQFMTLAASLAASIGAVLLMRRALSELRSGAPASTCRFHAFLSASLSGLALVAIAWSALPPLLSPTCE